MIGPNVEVINGQGRPRIITEVPTVYASAGTTSFTQNTVIEADGSVITNTNIVAAAGGADASGVEVTTTSVHGLTVGDWVNLAGVAGFAPAINGQQQVIKINSTTKYVVGPAYTSYGGGVFGTTQRLGDVILNGAMANMRVQAVYLDIDSGINEMTYGKIVGLSGNTITVDAWTNGVPSGGNQILLNGWIADLPYCKKLTEVFTADTLVHRLYRSRKESKERGWFYKAVLDYSNHLWGDTLITLQRALNTQENSSIILIPRVDAPSIQHGVFFDPSAPINMAMFGDGMGHKDIVFTFLAKETINNFPILDGYGSDYGGSYGDV